jgi:hypothetical protein
VDIFRAASAGLETPGMLSATAAPKSTDLKGVVNNLSRPAKAKERPAELIKRA